MIYLFGNQYESQNNFLIFFFAKVWQIIFVYITLSSASSFLTKLLYLVLLNFS